MKAMGIIGYVTACVLCTGVFIIGKVIVVVHNVSFFIIF